MATSEQHANGQRYDVIRRAGAVYDAVPAGFRVEAISSAPLEVRHADAAVHAGRGRPVRASLYGDAVRPHAADEVGAAPFRPGPPSGAEDGRAVAPARGVELRTGRPRPEGTAPRRVPHRPAHRAPR